MAAAARTRILFVHHRSELGGAPISLSHLIQRLDPERFEADVFCPRGAAADLFRRSGATVHTGPVACFTHIWASQYRGRRWLLFLREFARLPGHLVTFRRTLRRSRYDVVHLNDSPPVAAAWLARRHGVPVVWHLRSALPDDDAGLRTRLLRRAIAHFAGTTIAINEDVAASFGLDSTVVPNVVDLDRFQPGDAAAARDALGLPRDVPIVSYFGFLYPSKGFREFIEAARWLHDQGVEATFLMIGGAVRDESFFRRPVGRLLLFLDLARDYEREARDRVVALGLEESVRFVPFTLDTALYYQVSDIVVAPSRGPELGRPVLEAAASGIPIVASGSQTGGGVVVPGRTGVVVSQSGAEALAAAVAELLSVPERRAELGRAARAHAEAHFNPVVNMRRVGAIYDSVTGRKGRVRVLFVHHRPQLGGAPSSLATLIRHLDSRFEPHVYTPPGPAADLFAAAGATVHLGPAAIFAHIWDNPYRGLRWLVLSRELVRLPLHVLTFDRLMRRYRFPLVHLNDSPLVAAAGIAHHRGAKVVWHLRSALAGEGRDARSRAVCTLIERWGDALIAIDEDVAARFPVQLPLHIVHNSVEVGDERSDPTDAKGRLGLPPNRVAIGFAGFIRRPKGWPELVAAAELLVRADKPVHFVIIGGGVRPPAFFSTLGGRILSLSGVLADEETAINTLVAARSLVGHFSFVPFTSETRDIYRALDIVTFPNQGVGLGRPVLEAAMHGRPVVASGSATGAGILLPERTGILVRKPTPERLAEALARLVDDPELRRQMGEAARKHAREHFDPAGAARAVEQVYDELLGLERRVRAKAGMSPTTAARRR